jgi:uncharacterized protein YgfB (UPF0149 family)
MLMQGRSHSLSDHGAVYRALIALAWVVMVLLSGSTPARLAGNDWLTRHSDDRVEQIAAPNQTAAPTARLDIRFAEDLLDEGVEFVEPTDDDETKRGLLRLGAVLRLYVNAFDGQSGLFQSSADRAAQTPFHVLAFSSRGSPSA